MSKRELTLLAFLLVLLVGLLIAILVTQAPRLRAGLLVPDGQEQKASEGAVTDAFPLTVCAARHQRCVRACKKAQETTPAADDTAFLDCTLLCSRQKDDCVTLVLQVRAPSPAPSPTSAP